MIENPVPKIIVSSNGNIRSINHNGAVFYSVIDFMEYATKSKLPKVYWKNLKGRCKSLNYVITPLKIISMDNKYRLTDCAAEGALWCIYNCIPKQSLKETI